MLEIQKLAQTIEMLLNKADKYEDMASLLQRNSKETAMAFVELSEVLLAQVGKLHALAVKLIKEQEAKADVEIPAFMKAQWEAKHVYLVDKKAMLEHKIKNIKAGM